MDKPSIAVGTWVRHSGSSKVGEVVRLLRFRGEPGAYVHWAFEENLSLIALRDLEATGSGSGTA